MDERREEVAAKIALIRNRLGASGALRLRGSDWFAWITAGACNRVCLVQETGIAEVLVTPTASWILTDEIDAQRLLDEELSGNFQIFQARWAAPEERDDFVRDVVGICQVWSDRPGKGEQPIPTDLAQHKRILMPSEARRYQRVGQLAAEAVTEAMSAAQAEWTELDLAGATAQALWQRGLQPAILLAAGANRLSVYRNPLPTSAKLGRLAMLSVSAQGYGLHANLTRYMAFGRMREEDRIHHDQIRQIEAEALQCCVPGTRLDQIYQVLVGAYDRRGYAHAIEEHHQGGLTGYLPREIIATPMTGHCLNKLEAVAWNPSLAGVKIEDTFLVHGNEVGIENLTLSKDWPTVDVGGIPRPVVWER